MNMNEKKKVLFVIGMEQDSKSIVKKITSLQPNRFIFPCYEPILSPFSDFMRDIILAVYQENVEEIFVTVSNDDRLSNRENLMELYENKGLQEKLQTLDYLFKNCNSEFPQGSMREWLEGHTTSSSRMQNIVGVIRNHPLIPSDVKVTEYLIKNENQLEFASLRR
ncbi:carbonic anhydrase [Neobacillus drentensis]|uniref:carbonic anhydrase n=1 Tax=Neobacillus drentensis TaxID=220684 RepID=UPI002FFFA12C